MYNVNTLVLMIGIFHCINCQQLPWPTHNSASSASSNKAASNKYFHQNAYSADGNKEEHSSTTYLDGHNSAGDNANTYSEPSLARFLQPAKMPYITGKLPLSAYATADISPAPTKKHSFGDQLFSFFPNTDLLQSFSIVPKPPILETIPTIIKESFSPVITIEPVLSVLKKPPSIIEYELLAKQKPTGCSDISDKFNPVNSLIEISSQNSKNMYDDKADTIEVLPEFYKSNKEDPIFDLVDDDDDDDEEEDISSTSDPDLGELIFITEEIVNADDMDSDAEMITLLPSVVQSASSGIPTYSYFPNYYYMPPYPMIPIQPNSPSNEPLPAYGFLYDSGDMLPNDPVPMNELLLPELLYGNLPLQNAMSPYYVQQYPSWPNYYQEANSNKFQGATASASPTSATSDSLSRSTYLNLEDLKRF